MRILLWHGWLLEGSGSNVYTARLAEAYRAQGHDVVLLCQESHPDDFRWVDTFGSVRREVGALVHTGVADAPGRCTLLRPQIGDLLPVFVYDEYEGFTVKRFVDLTDDELRFYLDANVTAMRTAIAWHDPEVVITGHAIPGAAIARRAAGPGRYIAKIHGSDIEYAIKEQHRYVALAAEGLEGATAVVGAGSDVLGRIIHLVPSIADRCVPVPPGVDIARFRLRDGASAMMHAAHLLQADYGSRGGGGVGDDAALNSTGRPDAISDAVRAATANRDADAISALASRYDQGEPDVGAASVLMEAATAPGPMVGYLGKFIPQKGVERAIEAVALLGVRALIVGFGTFREWLEALAAALDNSDEVAHAWLAGAREDWHLELSAAEVHAAQGLRSRLAFTGKLDHRFAPAMLAAIDVLVVPSTLDEAFGMVAAEAASAGAFPMVARHSGLAEVAAALEAEVGRPKLFSFEPGDGATHRLAAGITNLLTLEPSERDDLRRGISGFVAREWSWEATARKLLEAAGR